MTVYSPSMESTELYPSQVWTLRQSNTLCANTWQQHPKSCFKVHLSLSKNASRSPSAWKRQLFARVSVTSLTELKIRRKKLDLFLDSVPHSSLNYGLKQLPTPTVTVVRLVFRRKINENTKTTKQEKK